MEQKGEKLLEILTDLPESLLDHPFYHIADMLKDTLSVSSALITKEIKNVKISRTLASMIRDGAELYICLCNNIETMGPEDLTSLCEQAEEWNGLVSAFNQEIMNSIEQEGVLA